MFTEVIHECIKKAMENTKVAEAIEKRETSTRKKARIKEVRGKIVKGKDTRDYTKLLVRVGFDFILKEDDSEVKEDILVNVRYELDKRNDNKESYQIKDEDIMFVPEID